MGERHAEVGRQRTRFDELRAMPAPDRDAQLELRRLSMNLEPDTDKRPALAAFNAAHPGHAPGLFIEGLAHLEKDEREGLALLERAMEFNPGCH